MLRGDGLTTTSLEILTGTSISTNVRAHWHLPLHTELQAMSTAGDTYTGSPPAEHAHFARVGFDVLHAGVGEDLLIRELDLVGDGVVLAAATVVAVLGVLPESIAHLLGTTDQPIGRLLATEQLQVRRELTRWGLRPSGHRADRLAVRPDVTVPARTYLMRAVSTGRPLAVIEEWFSPFVFTGDAESRRGRTGWLRRAG